MKINEQEFSRNIFISQERCPDFCNYRRSNYPCPDEDSIEEAVLSTLQSSGSLITKELRAACGFTGNRRMKQEQSEACFNCALQEGERPKVKGMRSKFK